MKFLKRLPQILLKAALALIGALSVVAIITSAIFIWIAFFDYDGGEPGSVTIFGSMILWPAFLIAIVAVSIGSARRPYIAGLAAGVAFIFVTGAWLTIQSSRARNAETRDGQNKSAMASPIPLWVD